MANTNFPTPVVIAGGALCVLAGYLIGVVAGPDTPDRTTGTVESFTRSSNVLCLIGDTVSEQVGADESGRLCGVWRRSASTPTPRVGDSFRFVSIRTSEAPEGQASDSDTAILIYGDVVD